MSTQIKTAKKPIEILLVEDNLGDVILMREILRLSRFPIHLKVARDGEEALAVLQQAEDFSDKGKPDLILLDLSLPLLSGHEVLAKIRKDPVLKDIPVLIMSGSSSDDDLREAYQHNANFYIVKPMDVEHFAVVISYIENFWLERIP